jgi:hypothetical protein
VGSVGRVDHEPAAVVLLDGVRQPRRGAEGVEVGEVEGPHVPPGGVRDVLERHGDHGPAAGDPQHLGEHRHVVTGGQVLQQVHGEDGVGRCVGQRDAAGVAGERADRGAERRSDAGQQPCCPRDQVDGRHPVALRGQP